MKKFIITIGILAISLGLIAQSSKDFNKFSKLIRKDRPDKVMKLIEKGKDINATDKLGKTPLLYSLQIQKTNFAEIFITAGSNIYHKDIMGNGCLHYSIEYCPSLDITYKLIDLGLDIDLINSSGITPFHLSIPNKCPELPFYLIERGADYKIVTSNKQNAIHLSILSGCDSLFNFLIEYNVDFDINSKYNNTPLLLAIEKKEGRMAQILLDKGAKISVKNGEGHSPFYLAIKKNDTLIFDALLRKLHSPFSDSEASILIDLAAWTENEYIVKQLLNNGSVNPFDCSTHDDCYKTAFVYFVSAAIANKNQKMKLYQNSNNIFKLTKEKYKMELNKKRANNTAIVFGNVFLILFGGYSVDSDYEGGRKRYLRRRISLCNEKIEYILNKIESL